MSKSMWILAAIFAVMAIALIYQSEVGGGVDRPWAECKESLVQQIFSGDCTSRTGLGGPRLEDGATSN
jgi:preprotein translocase subunit SecG